ncbi:MAG: cobyric acid synthase [Gaiellaceae bacterium]
MTALMIQGTTSWAGKSLLTTAVARMCARAGLSVAPFKAQNMSNNARVVDGGEIGTAQYLQALAAGVKPDVRMNPVLVKPEGDMRSQVVIDGKPDLELTLVEWRDRPAALWPVIERAYRSLATEFDLIVIEGAGSPAEINLRSTDLANMRVAEFADADVFLVSDISRGGAFAHLYGTWALLQQHERRRLQGFVLNKFRGDPALLAPGPERLEALTGVPTAATIPWLDHRLPDEDGVADPTGRGGRLRVAIVRYPTASNLDEFKPLEDVADLAWAGTTGELDGADLVVLPGSKNVGRDLAWLRETGIATAVERRADDGGAVLGICGGLQMLGRALVGHPGVDDDAVGIGLLDITTRFGPEKLTRQIDVELRSVSPAWAALEGLRVRGYEIRHGDVGEGVFFCADAVLGFSFHGAFENENVLGALFGRTAPSLEAALDELADRVSEHLPLERLLPRVRV